MILNIYSASYYNISFLPFFAGETNLHSFDDLCSMDELTILLITFAFTVPFSSMTCLIILIFSDYKPMNEYNSYYVN